MLTADHRWTSTEERARLAGMGIQLEGRTRLYGLNLSRCLGDKFLKVAAMCHVSNHMSQASHLFVLGFFLVHRARCSARSTKVFIFVQLINSE
jgi:Protein phosphatase 2C